MFLNLETARRMRLAVVLGSPVGIPVGRAGACIGLGTAPGWPFDRFAWFFGQLLKTSFFIFGDFKLMVGILRTSAACKQWGACRSLHDQHKAASLGMHPCAMHCLKKRRFFF